jgi:hypothetical protein
MRGLEMAAMAISLKGSYLKVAQNLFAGDLLVLCDLTEDFAEGPDPQWRVRWDYLLRPGRRFGPQHDVASNLRDPRVFPVAADMVCEQISADVAR